MTVSVIVIGIIFAIILQIFISLRAILRVNKKPIKDVIFDVQSTRYKINKFKVILGIILLISAFFINYFNPKANFILSLMALVFALVGLANFVPIVIRGFSNLFVRICKKCNWANGIVASKNIGYNKMIITSSRLIVVSIVSILMILTASNTFGKLFESFRYLYNFDLLVENISKSSEEYEDLYEIDGIDKLEYLYYFYDENIIYNDKNFNTIPLIIGLEDEGEGIKEFDYKIKDLKENEVLIDEKYAEKNDIKVNDTITITFGSLKKTFEYKVVGLINSAYFTTSRNVIVVNLNHYKQELTDIPVWIQITVKDGYDIEELENKIKNKVKEVGIQIETFDEYITKQEESSSAIMSMLYVIVGLAVVLAFIGIINNQIIGFMQRKRELAVLNSTCMSKKQLKGMLVLETFFANFISCALALIISYLLTNILSTALQSMELFVEIVFDWEICIKFVCSVFIILLLTLFLPLKRLRKINIVDEIKYE